jgi:ornithine cyclodeaminase/alanine dehydrogenase-like protein (mu-crystallin family)
MILRFTEEQVLAGLPMPVAIECLRSAFAAYGRGEAQNQPRRRLMLPTGSVLHSLAASYGAYFGTKGLLDKRKARSLVPVLAL